MGSATIFGASVADPDEFQRLFHGIDLNRGSGFDLNDMKAVVVNKDSFPMLYPYEFHCMSMEKVPKP